MYTIDISEDELQCNTATALRTATYDLIPEVSRQHYSVRVTSCVCSLAVYDCSYDAFLQFRLQHSGTALHKQNSTHIYINNIGMRL